MYAHYGRHIGKGEVPLQAQSKCRRELQVTKLLAAVASMKGSRLEICISRVCSMEVLTVTHFPIDAHTEYTYMSSSTDEVPAIMRCRRMAESWWGELTVTVCTTLLSLTSRVRCAA